MDKHIYYTKYAEAVLNIGVNLQPGDILYLEISVEFRELAEVITREAFLMGAKDVAVKWSDPVIEHYRMLNVSNDDLSYVPDYLKMQSEYFGNVKACRIICSAFYGDINDDVPDYRINAAYVRERELRSIQRKYESKGDIRWCAFAVGNPNWAEIVYPDMEKEEREDLFFKQMAQICRITEDTDPVENWREHCRLLSERSRWMNEQGFDRIHITTGLGTDLDVGLINGCSWCSAAELGNENTPAYCANIPTEEIFTSPDKRRVNGTVVASMPLILNGRMIEGFSFELRNGKAVSVKAKRNLAFLEDNINLSENSGYIGEIALVSGASPITKMNQLFYFGAIDENATSHMAFGTGFPTCLSDGESMSPELLDAIGLNVASNHMDFMYGTDDMKVIGIKRSGEKVVIMENGDFVI